MNWFFTEHWQVFNLPNQAQDELIESAVCFPGPFLSLFMVGIITKTLQS